MPSGQTSSVMAPGVDVSTERRRGASVLNRIVVVGAAAAGLTAVETLRAKGYEGELTLVGDERHPPTTGRPSPRSC